MPLILQGRAKKVIAISTGMADIDLTINFDIFQTTSYGISKIALNMAVAKFSALYRKEGVLCLSVCPGNSATGNMDWIGEQPS
jgi:NAD(P)-dependent dehydrogenase (short-subunit alcohol dehydrogenase family)